PASPQGTREKRDFELAERGVQALVASSPAARDIDFVAAACRSLFPLLIAAPEVDGTTVVALDQLPVRPTVLVFHLQGIVGRTTELADLFQVEHQRAIAGNAIGSEGQKDEYHADAPQQRPG